MLAKPDPRDNEPRTMGLPPALVTQFGDWITARSLKPGDLLFASRAGTALSRNTVRTRVWQPAVKASGITFNVRMHDLRHAHASWLLAGGADLKSIVDRMGHAKITTTQRSELHRRDPSAGPTCPTRSDRTNLGDASCGTTSRSGRTGHRDVVPQLARSAAAGAG